SNSSRRTGPQSCSSHGSNGWNDIKEASSSGSASSSAPGSYSPAFPGSASSRHRRVLLGRWSRCDQCCETVHATKAFTQLCPTRAAPTADEILNSLTEQAVLIRLRAQSQFILPHECFRHVV